MVKQIVAGTGCLFVSSSHFDSHQGTGTQNRTDAEEDILPLMTHLDPGRYRDWAFIWQEQKDLIVGWQGCRCAKTIFRFFAKDGVDLFRGEEGSSMGGSAPTAPVAVGKEYDVQIEDIAREGDGIARVEGFVIFVPQAKVGDQIKIEVDKVMRRFAIGHKV